MHRRAKLAFLAFAVVGIAPNCAGDNAIDVERSTITVHVGKGGLLPIAGHEHWIDAPIAEGALNSTDRPYVEFRVDTARMRVRPEPNVDAKTRAEIQKDMQEITLESARYPEVSFHSSRIKKRGDRQWDVEGILTVHGVTRRLALVVNRDGDAYVGHTTIMQTDFGIKPISVGGGMVKVKNELEIDFRIVTRPE